MKSPYVRTVLIASIIAAFVGSIVSGAVGAMIGFSVFGLIGATGYLIILAVRSADTTRDGDSSHSNHTHH